MANSKQEMSKAIMESHKERREQSVNTKESGQITEGEEKVAESENKNRNNSLIRESIISDGSNDSHLKKGHESGVAQQPDNLLVFSRCVHKTDSSLE